MAASPMNVLAGGKKILAPLVGGSDLSFRLLCRLYGAEVTFTEMCIAEYYVNKEKLSQKLKKYTFEFDPSDRPLILQLAGKTAEPIVQLANMEMFRNNIDGVDLNCGCPQGFALEKGIGCGLLRNPDRLADLCHEISSQIPYPFSIKMRLEDSVQHTIGIMERLRDTGGVQAFSVHTRYYWQKGEKRGVADWDALRDIKSAMGATPVIGNGDISQYSDFDRMMRTTGVDSAMVGYGALLNPSVFTPSPAPLSEVLTRYLRTARRHHNQLVDIQRHVAWMIKRSIKVASFKEQLFKTNTVDELITFLNGVEMSQPVYIDPALVALGEGETDRVQYPGIAKTERDQNRKRKAAEKRQAKATKKADNRAKRQKVAAAAASDQPAAASTSDAARSGQTDFDDLGDDEMG